EVRRAAEHLDDLAPRSAAAQNGFERDAAAVEQATAHFAAGRQAQAVAVPAERRAHRRDEPELSRRAAQTKDFRWPLHARAGFERLQSAEARDNALLCHAAG